MATSFARSALPLLFAAALLSACAAPPGQAPAAQAAIPPTSSTLTAFDSDEGWLRLARSSAKADLASLANQFEAQSNAAFCGPTSAAIVLNALAMSLGADGPATSAGTKAPDAAGARPWTLPRDRSRLRPEDSRHLPASVDISVPRFTQDSVIAPGAKTRAQVLGEPLTSNGRQLRDGGYQVRQFDQMLRANQAATRLVIVDEAHSDDAVRRDLVANLQRRGDYVVVNYRRELVGQQGGGHISPLGAYDAVSDSFLVMDVNPATAGWVWMPTAVLLRGMRSFDTIENRGYVHVERR